MYKGYPWTCADVLSLLGVRYNINKEENMIVCPFCGGNRFGMNIRKGTGHCFKCGETADSAGYYAASTGLAVQDAREDIKRRLNITDNSDLQPIHKVFKEVEQEDIAPIEVRDHTYREFLNELKLSDKNLEHLLKRGFTKDDIKQLGYKTYPSPDRISFEDLCRRLLKKGCKLAGVPGFYKDNNNDWTFIKMTQGIIIPQKNVNNQIEGFQIRKDDDLRKPGKDGEPEAKISWFSSKNFKNGTGAHTSIHIATDFRFNRLKERYEPVIHGDIATLTEGGMKADLCACLMGYEATFIAVQGVHALKPLEEGLIKLKEYGLKTVNIAFDMDYLTNPNVADAMKKVEELLDRLNLNKFNMMNWESEISEDGENFTLKGLDDYLAYQLKKIKPIVSKHKEAAL